MIYTLVALVVGTRLLEFLLGGTLIWHGTHDRVALWWSFLIITTSIPMLDYHTILSVTHPLRFIFEVSGSFNEVLMGFALICFPGW